MLSKFKSGVWAGLIAFGTLNALVLGYCLKVIYNMGTFLIQNNMVNIR